MSEKTTQPTDPLAEKTNKLLSCINGNCACYAHPGEGAYGLILGELRAARKEGLEEAASALDAGHTFSDGLIPIDQAQKIIQSVIDASGKDREGR